jgi:7,8-dihydropterin-6-yl-methyl-4-(beta-D-ribofuranosyl)aminobenzene 5'-phosphate synthase
MEKLCTKSRKRSLAGMDVPEKTRSAGFHVHHAVSVFMLLINFAALAGCQNNSDVPTRTSSENKENQNRKGWNEMSLSIFYDNNPGRKDMKTDWGFACVIRGLEKNILFDTGGNGRILLDNMQTVGIEPNQIDIVVISHIHGDHTGGLDEFLEKNPHVDVYIPTGFPASFKDKIRPVGGKLIEGDEPIEICTGAKTTGTMGKGAIEEQGLCVETESGWVLITGCAHPGVAKMTAAAKEVTDGQIALVAGGYHMGFQSARTINEVINLFEKMGVKAVAPCHCTGDQARELFKKRFGDRCMLVGVGSVIDISSAQAQIRL